MFIEKLTVIGVFFLLLMVSSDFLFMSLHSSSGNTVGGSTRLILFYSILSFIAVFIYWGAQLLVEFMSMMMVESYEPTAVGSILDVFTEPIILVVISIGLFGFQLSIWSKLHLLFTESVSGVGKSVPWPIVTFSLPCLFEYIMDSISQKEHYYLYAVDDTSIICIRMKSLDQVVDILNVTPDKSDSFYVYNCERCDGPVRSPKDANIYQFNLRQANTIPSMVKSRPTTICNGCIKSIRRSDEFSVSEDLKTQLVATNI